MARAKPLEARTHTVGRNCHEVHHVRNGDLAAEIHQKGDAAAQDADQQQVIIGIIRADLRAQLGNALFQSGFVDQNFRENFFIILHSHLQKNFVIISCIFMNQLARDFVMQTTARFI